MPLNAFLGQLFRPYFIAFALAFFTAALCSPSRAAGPTGLLNDTGQTRCKAAGAALVTCDTASTGDTATNPRQDGRFGRDVAAPAKVGGGVAGFDFTKVCQDGTLNCTTAASLANRPNPTDWACTKDNVTNLVWSLYTGSGDWTTYARGALPTDHNAAVRCGYSSGWRLPTRRELLSIVNNDGSNPSIDAAYFPATPGQWYWTNDLYHLGPTDAWAVFFVFGFDASFPLTTTLYVRLVRSGP